MRKRSSTPPTDPTVAAFEAVQRLTDSERPSKVPKKRNRRKNPAAVALGRLGGKVGGKRRAEKLSAEQRSDIARKAAETRWRKQS